MTRSAIRQAAAERFFHQGYESTTVREIADALDIRAASIYYHYPDKQQILFELIDSAMTLLADGVRAAVAAHAAPADQLAAVVVHHVVLHALRPLEATLGETELRSLTGERLELAVPARRLRGDRLGVLERGIAARRVRAARPEADGVRGDRDVHERRHLVPARRPADPVRGRAVPTRPWPRGSQAPRRPTPRSSTALLPQAVAAYTI